MFPMMPRQGGPLADRHLQLLADPPNNDRWTIGYRAGTLSWIPCFDAHDASLMEWDANSSATTGLTAQGATGLTATEDGTLTQTTVGSGIAAIRVANYATDGTSNDVAGWHSSEAQPVGLPDTIDLVLFTIVTPVITSVRIWMGLTNQTLATMAAGADPAGHRVGVRYDTSASDPGWMMASKDNSTAINTAIGSTPAATEEHSFCLSRSRSSTQAWDLWHSSGRGVWVKRSAIVAGGPAEGTSLFAVYSVTALAASVRNARVARVRVLRH